jgi:hypothetical protein
MELKHPFFGNYGCGKIGESMKIKLASQHHQERSQQDQTISDARSLNRESSSEWKQTLATLLSLLSIIAALTAAVTVVRAWFVVHALSDFDGGSDSGVWWAQIGWIALPALATSIMCAVIAHTLHRSDIKQSKDH